MLLYSHTPFVSGVLKLPMNKKNFVNFKRLLKKSPFEFLTIAVMLLVFLASVLPLKAWADETLQYDFTSDNLAMQIQAMQNGTLPYGDLPESNMRPPSKYMKVAVTAYNSVPWQTDATPCIGARGADICAYLKAGSNTCAANFVPIGTVLEVEGLGTCVVRDRMNRRYWYRVDWYMGDDIAAAKAFGVRYKQIGIYSS